LQVASKFRALSPTSLATVAFYGVAGILFIILTFLSGFAPHIAILGIVSLAAEYGLFAKRNWAVWLVGALLFIGTTFSVVSLYYVVGLDILTTVGMVAYLVLTWVFTAIAIKTRQYD
jgi:SNF family Na+-dependent transporter